MLCTLRFFFSLQNAVCFIMLTCLVPVLFTFYIQGVLKLKKNNNSGAKGLMKANKPDLTTTQAVSHRTVSGEAGVWSWANPVRFVVARGRFVLFEYVGYPLSVLLNQCFLFILILLFILRTSERRQGTFTLSGGLIGAMSLCCKM